jgi:hypothetical protein
MDQYFEATGSCPNSLEVIDHSKVTTVRCGPCGLLNPRHSKLVARARARTPPSIEIIEIKDSPVDPRSAPPRGGSTAEQGIKPARRRGLATHIPSLPDLKLGHAEKERQAADQRVADRKPKTGYIALIPVVHFSVGIAHFTWDDDSDDQGFWNAANHQWSVDQDNRSMTSDSLQHSILFGVAKQSKRANLKKWVYPDANGERGEWSFGHTNPTKVSPRDIATWEDTRMLSTVVDSGPYEQKPVPGTTRKLVSLWLYWTPNEPERDEPPIPIPRKRQKANKTAPIKTESSAKSEIKTESSVKSEVKDEPPPPVTPATVRRYKSGALISAPTSAAKRSGATVTRRALAASDSDIGESAGEGESESESRRKGTGDPRGSEDLQDIREMLDEAEGPIE